MNLNEYINRMRTKGGGGGGKAFLWTSNSILLMYESQWINKINLKIKACKQSIRTRIKIINDNVPMFSFDCFYVISIVVNCSGRKSE